MSSKFSYSTSYNSSPYIAKPRRKRFNLSMTWIIIGFTVLVYIIQNVVDYFTLDPVTGAGAFTRLFAVTPSLVLKGHYLWTLVTNIFLHVSIFSSFGIFHIIFNMISLIFIGSFLERIIGKKKFLIIYLIFGIVASAFFVLSALVFKQDLAIPALGASGAIFGVGGVLAILTPKVKVYMMFIPIAMPLWLGMILMLASLWIISAAAGLPIGNFAHLGGFVVGLFYGIYLRTRYRKHVQVLDRYFSNSR